MNELAVLDEQFLEYNEVGLSVKRIITWDEAVAKTHTFDGLESVVQFYIGDWLEHCEKVFGEQYAQLIPTGKESSWRVYQWVSASVKPEHRRRSLKWSHHMAVAGLLQERQVYLLDQAEQNQWTVKDLWREIKGEPKHRTKSIECPNCHHIFEV